MPKLTHCGRRFSARSLFVLPCEPQWADEFASQVMQISVCTVCGDEIRGWYGILHDGTEDRVLCAIRKRRFPHWDERVQFTQSRNIGVLSVRVQRHYDGKYSDGFRLVSVS